MIERRRIDEEVLRHDRRSVVPSERCRSRERLVEHDAGGIDIGRGRGLLAAALLWGHVSRCPLNGPCLREGVDVRALSADAREPEVDERHVERA